MTQRIGGIKAALSTPTWLRRGMNLWPPYLFAGVRIEAIDPDWRRVRVRLAKTPMTTNYFGTQFGGSLFAMVDPFWVIMLIHNLGTDHVVWDKAGEIEFVTPGKTAVRAELVLDPVVVEELRARAAGGERVLHWFECDILDAGGAVVSRTRKQVYIRRKTAPSGMLSRENAKGSASGPAESATGSPDGQRSEEKP